QNLFHRPPVVERSPARRPPSRARKNRAEQVELRRLPAPGDAGRRKNHRPVLRKVATPQRNGRPKATSRPLRPNRAPQNPHAHGIHGRKVKSKEGGESLARRPLIANRRIFIWTSHQRRSHLKRPSSWATATSSPPATSSTAPVRVVVPPASPVTGT